MILIYICNGLVFHSREATETKEMIGQTSRGQAGVPQTVAGLSTPEQFVLGVCRCWDAFVDGPDPTLAWRELTPVFAYMNVLGAFCAFERIFAVLRAQPMLALEFHEVDAAQLSADEARLIYGLACLQRGRPEAAISVLRQSLT